MPHHCSAYGCSNNSSKDDCKQRGVSFFKFPLEDIPLLKKWLVAMRREHFEPNIHSKLCSDHFKLESLECKSHWNGAQIRQLKKDAVPSIFEFKPKEKNEVPTSYTRGASRDITIHKIKNNTRCAFCKAIRSTDFHLKFFHFPRDADLSKKWLKALNLTSLCKISSDDLHKKYFICSKHFQDKDYSSPKLHRLHSTACPFVLNSNCSETVDTENINISSIRQSLKFQLQSFCDDTISDPQIKTSNISDDSITLSLISTPERKSRDTINHLDVPSSETSFDECDDFAEQSSSVVDVFGFSNLKNNVNLFLKNMSWTTSISSNFIAFLFWNDSCLERWIVINGIDLNAKVYLKGRLTTIGGTISSFQDLSDLIKKVEITVICSGVNENDSDCLGYLHDTYQSKSTGCCSNCRLRKYKH